MTKIQDFKNLHQNEQPLLIGNVWNVQSAKVYENLDYKAVATSSSAVAHSLGYEDGEQISFEEYFYIIERIIKSVSIPLSVDLESGYGNDVEKIVDNISRLSEIGVVGINLEDSFIINGTRQLLDKETFYKKLKAIIDGLNDKGIEIFINIRTDTFLLGLENALNETLERIKMFEELGVDGVFVPCITSEKDIEAVTKSTKLPINVMCMKDLPNFETLQKLDIKRISSGNFLNDYIYENLKEISQDIISKQDFSPVFL
ncbi:isocitrate lyase/PEP mutase family protein [Epilithonimonas hungarica]|uniref:2-Methylisocitrate lyase, PEP mutase family n=1 Tax=Epilithonimonas hungarica TaxID=454006 RepID=A0A1G7IG05_9FLAO|nr:isocitrate lyase/phosphoenolpyruvate mutase family protein [Epilithonimonas hungarica]SDF11454.1 2-Methylisocitrate lyase, PEP mutase family [Epilithonimonas hungarica]